MAKNNYYYYSSYTINSDNDNDNDNTMHFSTSAVLATAILAGKALAACGPDLINRSATWFNGGPCTREGTDNLSSPEPNGSYDCGNRNTFSSEWANAGPCTRENMDNTPAEPTGIFNCGNQQTQVGFFADTFTLEAVRVESSIAFNCGGPDYYSIIAKYNNNNNNNNNTMHFSTSAALAAVILPADQTLAGCTPGLKDLHNWSSGGRCKRESYQVGFPEPNGMFDCGAQHIRVGFFGESFTIESFMRPKAVRINCGGLEDYYFHCVDSPIAEELDNPCVGAFSNDITVDAIIED
ncbi:hypothetical protein E4U43_006893 [Claviceps pusilla]|uniref:Uncharacterized protein n=1 Tax=Claviceps pusilla TaxID=123648 RepID=A0A9P7NFP2_9HYPO|nr:hypothetical protein E4U43_006893 [Claviceps pusilla]